MGPSGAVTFNQNCTQVADTTQKSVFYSSGALKIPTGKWLVRQSVCAPGATGCSASCGLQTQYLMLQTLAEIIAGVPAAQLRKPTIQPASVSAVEIASTAPFPLTGPGVDTFTTRQTTQPYTLTFSASSVSTR